MSTITISTEAVDYVYGPFTYPISRQDIEARLAKPLNSGDLVIAEFRPSRSSPWETAPGPGSLIGRVKVVRGGCVAEAPPKIELLALSSPMKTARECPTCGARHRVGQYKCEWCGGAL